MLPKKSMTNTLGLDKSLLLKKGYFIQTFTGIIFKDKKQLSRNLCATVFELYASS
jgi:hypothetical protein